MSLVPDSHQSPITGQLRQIEGDLHLALQLTDDGLIGLMALVAATGFEPGSLLRLLLADVLGAKLHRQYAQNVAEEEQLWQRYGARVAARAPLEELDGIRDRLGNVRAWNVRWASALQTPRSPDIQELVDRLRDHGVDPKIDHEWTEPPRPRVRGGGRPRLEDQADMTWVRLLVEAMVIHRLQPTLRWFQVAERVGLSENQLLEYRGRAGFV